MEVGGNNAGMAVSYLVEITEDEVVDTVGDLQAAAKLFLANIFQHLQLVLLGGSQEVSRQVVEVGGFAGVDVEQHLGHDVRRNVFDGHLNHKLVKTFLKNLKKINLLGLGLRHVCLQHGLEDG